MSTTTTTSSTELIAANAAVLAEEMEWLRQVIDVRLRLYFGHETPFRSITEIGAPDVSKQAGFYARFIQERQLNFMERLVLALALAPHVKPEILDAFFAKNQTYDKPFSEFGGLRGRAHAGFLPTGETAFFLFAGTDMKKRLLMNYVFSNEFFLAREHILRLDPVERTEPRASGRLELASDYIDFFTTGIVRKPDFSQDFPAKLETSDMEWDDVVLPQETVRQVMEVKDWIDYGHQLMNGMGLSRKLRPGFKVLFYGSPGTGKTLVATLLGKTTGRDVYKIDLSMIVSKYIGETEKNLAKVFDQAENKNWILFFDEADALFGKRTELNSSHDRFANQEVSYLLQRIEQFPGVVILASNFKDNIDAAFTRRFQVTVRFPSPGKEERHALWERSFSEKTKLDPEIDLEDIAERYKITGGLMTNVVRYCTVQAVKRGDNLISHHDLETALKREMEKEGVVLV